MLKILSLHFIGCISLERDKMTVLNCELASKTSNDKSTNLHRQNKTSSLEIIVSGFVCLFVGWGIYVFVYTFFQMMGINKQHSPCSCLISRQALSLIFKWFPNTSAA